MLAITSFVEMGPSPKFQKDDRVRLRYNKLARGRVVQAVTVPRETSDKTIRVKTGEVTVLADSGAGFATMDFDLEYDPLEQLARE